MADFIPQDSSGFTEDDALDEILFPGAIPEVVLEEDDIAPIGRTVLMDFDVGRAGTRPQWVTDSLAVIQVAQVALRTRQGEHAMFSDGFGTPDPDDGIGYVDSAQSRAVATQNMKDTLLNCHERITNVGDFLFQADESGEILYVDLTIEIDSDAEVRLTGVPLD